MKETLKKKSTDINKQNDGGKTPIFYVTRKDIMYYLFLLGANMSHRDANSNNPLDKAINMKLKERTSNLLQLGARPTELQIYSSDESHIYENLILYNDFYINIVKEIIDKRTSFLTIDRLIPLDAINRFWSNDPKSIYHCLGGSFDFWSKYNSQVLPLKILIVHFVHKNREENESAKNKIDIPINFPQKLLEVGTVEQLLSRSPNKINNKKRKA
jgi:hypothetical protein